MKLYFSPGACSLSPHIALFEAGLKFETERVDLKQKKTASGRDFNEINPKGYVPALELDDGTLLTEGPMIVQYIADRAPAKKLAPAPESGDRYRLQEWLTFVNSEIHKSFGPLFDPKGLEEAKNAARQKIAKRLAIAEKRLSEKPYLMGDAYSVADGYLYVMLRWCEGMNLDISALPGLVAFKQRISQRPAVQEALVAEGLSKG